MTPLPRLVYDTNIFISRLLMPDGIAANALRKGLKHGQVFVSDATLAELTNVLSRTKFDHLLSIAERQDFLRKLSRVVQKITVIQTIQACRDPKDDKFLELAISAQAEIIVTGDKDLLILNPFQTVRIMTPAEYLDL